jgi:hypothetical protein
MPSLTRTPADTGNDEQRGNFYQQAFVNRAVEAPNSFEHSISSRRPPLVTGLNINESIHHQYLLSRHLMQSRLLQQRQQQLISAAGHQFLHSTISRSNNAQRQYQIEQQLNAGINPYYPSNRSVETKRPTEVIVIDDSDDDDDNLPEASPFQPKEQIEEEEIPVIPIEEPLEVPDPKIEPLKDSKPKSAEVEISIVIPADISEVVSLASSMTADEVRSGVYSVSNQSQNDLEGKAALLETFAKDVILPSLLAASNACIDFDEDSDNDANDTDSTSADSKSNRVFIASLMNLREVMAMNAASIFAFQDKSSSNGSPSETWTIQALGIATSVVAAVVQKLNDDSISTLLFETISGYDSSNEDFVSCLERADARTLGVTPNRLLNSAENNAFRVSFNTARAVHPLVARYKEDTIELPAATTAFISMVEVGTEVEDDYTRESKKRKA